MTDTITTNLRLSSQDWLQVKTLAAEKGMSFNEFIIFLIKNMNNWLQYRMMTNTKSPLTLKDLPGLTQKINRGKMVSKAKGLSKEDEDIYGI